MTAEPDQVSQYNITNEISAYLSNWIENILQIGPSRNLTGKEPQFEYCLNVIDIF